MMLDRASCTRRWSCFAMFLAVAGLAFTNRAESAWTSEPGAQNSSPATRSAPAMRDTSQDAALRDSLSKARDLMKQGRYGDAEALTRRLLPAAEAVDGNDSLQVAGVLAVLVDALVNGGKVKDPGSRQLAEQALRIRTRALGPDHLDVARSLNSLAVLLRVSGDYAGARPLFDRALAIREKALGPEHPDVAATLNNLAVLLWQTGDFAGARPLYERALAIKEKALGPDHPSVAAGLNNLALLLRSTGDYDEARPLYERALAIKEKALGPEHPDVAAGLNNLANVLSETGDYGAARSLYERALRIYEKALGDHPETATNLNNLANVLRSTGDYAGARPLHERALAIREKVLGPDHPDVAQSLNNLANILRDTGDYAAARPLYERALAINEKAFGPDHPDVAGCLSNLADLLVDASDYAGARPLYERALAIDEKAYGPDHPELAWNLIALANLLRNTGDDVGARPLYERALAIDEKAYGPDHPDVATALNNLAGLLADVGDYRGARSLFERVVAIDEKALGPDHPYVAAALSSLARTDLALGAFAAVLDTALRAERIGREHLRLTAHALAERQALQYAAVRASGLDLALAAVERLPGPEPKRRVLDAVIGSRALVLDEMGARHHARGDLGDSALATLAERVMAASTRYANRVVRGPGSEHPERYAKILEEARHDKEDAERALAERSLAFRDEQARSRVGLTEIASALAPGSALVSLVRYGGRDSISIPMAPIDARSGSDRPSDGRGMAELIPSYMAFVLRAGEVAPAMVPLGSAQAIDSLVARWRQAVARVPDDGSSAYRRIGVALRRAVWDPVAAHLTAIDRVFLVPDGALQLVNFATLPVGQDRYLLETGPLLHGLSAERDLVTSHAARGQGLMAFGGISYRSSSPLPTPGLVPAVKAVPDPGSIAARVYRGAASDCESFARMRFDSLRATAAEAAEVVASWNRSSAGTTIASATDRHRESAVELTGARASEAAFKQLAPHFRVLHLATHGFFMDDGCPSKSRGGAAGENPLLRSGLALAGANRRHVAKPGKEDGILTAEEIAALDLSRVEWVVLSACNTGVGTVVAGEGVFGLRRAFEVAGAGTLIMSLWKVEDVSTRRWMRALYAARLEKKLSTAESVRAASLQVLEERRRRGQSTHPATWGAFIAAGDWR